MLFKGRYFLDALLTLVCSFVGPRRLVESVLEMFSGPQSNIHACSVNTG